MSCNYWARPDILANCLKISAQMTYILGNFSLYETEAVILKISAEETDILGNFGDMS